MMRGGHLATFLITERGVVVRETYGISPAELRDRLDVPLSE